MQLRRFDRDGSMVCRFKPASGPQNFAGAGEGDSGGGTGRSGMADGLPEWMKDVYSLAR